MLLIGAFSLLVFVLQHINDISFTIPMEEMLKKAEGICLQMLQYKKLPPAVKEILGLVPPSPSSSNSSSAGTPAPREPSPFPAPPANGAYASSNGASPDDSSIEILNDAAETAISNFYQWERSLLPVLRVTLERRGGGSEAVEGSVREVIHLRQT